MSLANVICGSLTMRLCGYGRFEDPERLCSSFSKVFFIMACHLYLDL